MSDPLILVTNDDGVEAPGLWAAVRALLPLGEVLVAAPSRQWSGASRSLGEGTTGAMTESMREIDGCSVRAMAFDLPPSRLVDNAVLEWAPRRPNLIVSGINWGTNLGDDIGVSGTVGAALQCALLGIPALAMSLDIGNTWRTVPEGYADYSVAAAFTHVFASRWLKAELPGDIDVLNVNVPQTATPETPWRLTRMSRARYHVPQPRQGEDRRGSMRHHILHDYSHAEPDSDIWAVAVERIVSVTPLSFDMTSRVDLGQVDMLLRRNGHGAQTQVQEPAVARKECL